MMIKTKGEESTQSTQEEKLIVLFLIVPYSH